MKHEGNDEQRWACFWERILRTMNNDRLRLGEKTSPCNWPEKSQNHDEARWERWACFWERILSENDEQRETEIGGLPKIITRVLLIWWWILAYAPCIRITLMHNNFNQQTSPKIK
jgi:hypothetical protein